VPAERSLSKSQFYTGQPPSAREDKILGPEAKEGRNAPASGCIRSGNRLKTRMFVGRQRRAKREGAENLALKKGQKKNFKGQRHTTDLLQLGKKVC